MTVRTGATLEIDLASIAANFRLLSEKHAKKSCAAVVKANAYGLGVTEISHTLWQAGCREFFVATLAEALELRDRLPTAEIGVFNGLFAGEEADYAQHNLIPVLNDPSQIERFMAHGELSGSCRPILHVDTGMTRLGLSASELAKVPATLRPSMIMSHLACSSEPSHPKNAEQLARFRQALEKFPGVRASLANSSGIFLSSDYHFDLGRPGCGIYGIHPHGQDNPLKPVAVLSAPILQVRTLDRDEQVGYGATYAAKKGAKIAIVALGYADGYFRSLSNQGAAYIGARKAPLVGRVSMDMIALDVSGLPEPKPGERAEFINAELTVNDMAAACGTIGYEVFTRIGSRVKRLYRPL